MWVGAGNDGETASGVDRLRQDFALTSWYSAKSELARATMRIMTAAEIAILQVSGILSYCKGAGAFPESLPLDNHPVLTMRGTGAKKGCKNGTG